MLEDGGKINLNEFKKIIKHFKNIVNQQLLIRERIEDILKIKIEVEKEFELRYVMKDFYNDMLRFIYGKDSQG